MRDSSDSLDSKDLDPATKKDDSHIEQLTKEYGDPFLTKGKDDNEVIIGFNEHFWSAVVRDENQIIYEPDQKCFWKYDIETGLFSKSTDERIRELIRTRLFQAAEDCSYPEIRTLCTVRRIDVIVKAMKGTAEARGFFLEQVPAIHLKNGMVVEEDGQLTFEKGFSPDYRSRNQSPYSYSDRATCSRFLNELLYPMLIEPSDRFIFQKWMGLALSGLNPAQRLLLLDGTPGRGKGVLLRIVIALVGRQNTTELRTAHLGQRFELNRFVGKSLLQASDVPGNFLMQRWASILKSLVGGDFLDTEAKGANESHEITGDFNVLIVSNSRLRCRLDGDAGAWRRRLIILRTEAPPVEKKIPNFEQILLEEEGSGILQWALHGYQRACEDLREYGDLVLSDVQKKRVEMLLAESSSLEIFVQDRIERQSGCVATVDEILKAFAEFCTDKGWQMPPQSQATRELPDLMLRYHHAAKSNSIKTDEGTRRGFRGARIKS